MNRKREFETYDRIAVGARIQERRKFLAITQDELAERIDRATKYVSEIERGICGMSIETMLAFSKELDMSIDYMLFGESGNEKKDVDDPQTTDILHILSKCSEQKKDYALRLLKLFLAATNAPR